MNAAYVIARSAPAEATVWTEGSLIPSEPWMQDASCVGARDLHFPHGRPEQTPQQVREQTTRAKAMCFACPVIADCLEYALRNGETEGVWGGTTPKERAAVHRLKESRS